MLRAAVLAMTIACCFLLPRGADACRVLEIDFTPSPGLQIVIWLEDAEGNYLDTLFMTEATGRFGLGNRPGIMEFNSEYLWPYGRRETLFPVWARRRGVTYPRLVFQDGFDRDLSHAFSKSSAESFYCRPFRTDEPIRDRSVDTGTCATVAYTDKGTFHDSIESFYPPRGDLAYQSGIDHPDVLMFRTINDLDAVSRATPRGNEHFAHAVAVPTSMPEGEYRIWMEVAKEFDQNSHYGFPAPSLQSYGDYGQPYRGQPSVLWSVPIVLDTETRTAQIVDYVGYGDPDGLDGNVREPDETITTGQHGRGAGRLLLSTGEEGMYRMRVRSLPSESMAPPEPPRTMEIEELAATAATVRFVEPMDPTTGGAVRGFEVRISMGVPLTAENLLTNGRVVSTKLTPQGPGKVQSVPLVGLQPETRYWVAIRAQDDCLNGSAPAILELVTPRFEPPEVAACFVATAAWGSPLMSEVSFLRGFRDRMLRQVALGEILVETYYTFGPALAGVIRPSPTLRQVTRGGLSPLVEWVRRSSP